ncbi:Cell death protease [Rhodotorula kratochvilovae]
MVRVAAAPVEGALLSSDVLSEQQRPHKRQRQASLPTASDLWVERLPGLPDAARLSLFAGNLPSAPPPSTSDAHLYFLLARNKHIPKRERLVIWLNGGPGCSSFDGALIELGPVKVNKDGTLRVVESTAWNEYANVLFLDQPAGTGFSYVTKNDDVRELAAAADHVVAFLANFYKVFPEFSYMDTYIAGESYAGQYIPYIADAIEKTTLIPTRLKGLLIGNGWISPREQYPAYLTYLEREGLVKKGSQAHKNVLAATEKCNKTLAAMEAKGEGGKGTVLVADCEAILGVMSAATMKDGKCLNSYDTREYFTCGTEWPHQLDEVTKYLRRKDVVSALHGEGGPRGKEWTHCSPAVGAKFWTPNSVPSIALFPELLEKMPILLYAGDKDLMCAGVGIEAAVANLEWNGERGFGDAEALEWTVGEEHAGRWTTARNLSYVEFKDSSHMVPLDKPLAAHDMLLRFMQVDTLHSAGNAARIPSSIGKEEATVIGATHPNGTTLQGIAELASDEVDEGPKEVSEEGYDIEHERFYGPRRTAALVILLVLLAAAIWAILHWRQGRRRERYRRLKGKGRAIALDERAAPSASGRRSGSQSYRDRQAAPEPVPTEMPETVAVFDVGEEDESDEEDEERKRYREDPEAWGDLGRVSESEHPWDGKEGRY